MACSSGEDYNSDLLGFSAPRKQHSSQSGPECVSGWTARDRSASRVRTRESYARAARLSRRRRGSEGGEARTVEGCEAGAAVGVAE